MKYDLQKREIRYGGYVRTEVAVDFYVFAVATRTDNKGNTWYIDWQGDKFSLPLGHDIVAEVQRKLENTKISTFVMWVNRQYPFKLITETFHLHRRDMGACCDAGLFSYRTVDVNEDGGDIYVIIDDARYKWMFDLYLEQGARAIVELQGAIAEAQDDEQHRISTIQG